MRKLRDILRNKFAGRVGQSGESLVEVLVAMTIAGLSMIMLAMAIGVSTKIVSNSADAANDYYGGNNGLVAVSSGGSEKISEGKSTIKITEKGLKDASASTEYEASVNYALYANMPGMPKGNGISYEATELTQTQGSGS